MIVKNQRVIILSPDFGKGKVTQVSYQDSMALVALDDKPEAHPNWVSLDNLVLDSDYSIHNKYLSDTARPVPVKVEDVWEVIEDNRRVGISQYCFALNSSRVNTRLVKRQAVTLNDGSVYLLEDQSVELKHPDRFMK